jgi:hypothetical protein
MLLAAQDGDPPKCFRKLCSKLRTNTCTQSSQLSQAEVNLLASAGRLRADPLGSGRQAKLDW